MTRNDKPRSGRTNGLYVGDAAPRDGQRNDLTPAIAPSTGESTKAAPRQRPA